MIPRSFVITICVIPWILGIFVLFWILTLRFPLSGLFHTESDMTGRSAYIFPFLPGERTTSPGKQADGWSGQRIIADPVYMNIRTPGPYQSVDVEMDFRAIHQPLVEFGMVLDAEGKQLDLHPWYSEVLENPVWNQVSTSQGVQGYVLAGIPASRLGVSDTRRLAVWDATTTGPIMADMMLPERKTISMTLRGAHDFWVVPADEKIDFQMHVQDVNRNRSGGMLALQVLHNNQLVWQDTIGTGGNRDLGYGAIISVDVKLKDLRPGVYRIKVIGDDDIFIRQISTPNPRWVVGPRLVVGDIVGFATTSTNSLTAWTTARHVVAETFHKEGQQKISLGSAFGNVERTHTPVRIDRVDAVTDPVTITAPRGDIRLVADGYFALIQETFFEPQPRRMTPETDAIKEGIDAILTPYTRVEDLGDGWMRARMTVPVTNDSDTLRFVVSAPGIASRAGAIDVKRVAVTFHRPPMTFDTWWTTLLSEAKRAWRRL